MIALDESESFFCEYCHTCIGQGLVIETICYRHKSICVPCRWDIIRSGIKEFDLVFEPKIYSIKEIEIFLKNGKIEKLMELKNQLDVIEALNQAIANYPGNT